MNDKKQIEEIAENKLTYGIQVCSKCQYKLRCEECVYNEKDISEIIKFEKQQVKKDTAREILQEIRGYYPVDIEHCDKSDAFILRLCFDLAKQYGVDLGE